MTEMDLFLKAVLFPDALDDGLDVDDVVVVHPLGKFIEDRQLEVALEKTGGLISDPSWDEPVGVQETLKPLGKAVRCEVSVIDGERVSTHYDRFGNVVDKVWLLPQVSRYRLPEIE